MESPPPTSTSPPDNGVAFSPAQRLSPAEIESLRQDKNSLAKLHELNRLKKRSAFAVELTNWLIDSGDWAEHLDHLRLMCQENGARNKTPPADPENPREIAMEIQDAFEFLIDQVSLTKLESQQQEDPDTAFMFGLLLRELLPISEGDHYGPER